MVLRFLLFFLLAYLFFLLLGFFLSWRRQKRTPRSKSQGTEPEEMVLDPQCNSYLPKGEAIFRSGHYFCSEECARVFLSR